MSEYWFGSSISREFYPLQAGEPYPLPTQNPSIYLFSSQPSAEDALSGTGAFRTVSSWSQSSITPYRATYTLDPIAPPSEAATKCLGFWESVKIVAAAGGSAQAVLRYFVLKRPEATDADPATSPDDLKDIYPGIGAYITDDEIPNYLADAREELKIELEGRGLSWARIGKLNKARLVLAYKTIALASFSQFQTQGDRHWVRWQEFTTKYKALLDDLKLPYDTDGNGEPDAKAQPNYTSVVISK